MVRTLCQKSKYVILAEEIKLRIAPKKHVMLLVSDGSLVILCVG